MALKLGTRHWLHNYCQVCSNDDPGLTSTSFTARSKLVPFVWVWENAVDFQETIEACEVKVGTYSQIWFAGNNGNIKCTLRRDDLFVTSPNLGSLIRNAPVICNHWPPPPAPLPPTNTPTGSVPFTDTYIRHFQTYFPQETLSPFGASIGCWDYLFVQIFRVTWPRLLPGPYMVKTSKNVLRNQEADDTETWYTASGTQVQSNVFKWWHWVDLFHFYDMVKYVT